MMSRCFDCDTSKHSRLLYRIHYFWTPSTWHYFSHFRRGIPLTRSLEWWWRTCWSPWTCPECCSCHCAGTYAAAADRQESKTRSSQSWCQCCWNWCPGPWTVTCLSRLEAKILIMWCCKVILRIYSICNIYIYIYIYVYIYIYIYINTYTEILINMYSTELWNASVVLEAVM